MGKTQKKRIRLFLLLTIVALVVLLASGTYFERWLPDRAHREEAAPPVRKDKAALEESAETEPRDGADHVLLTVLVTDQAGHPLAGARVAAGTLKEQTDGRGQAVFELALADRRRWWVIAEKLGYFQAKNVAAPKEGRTEHSITLRMRREAQLRVLDVWGKEIRDYTLTTLYGAPVPDTLGVRSLTGVRVIVGAPGYVSIRLAQAPLGHPGTIGTEAMVYLVATSDLPEVRVHVRGAPLGSIAYAYVIARSSLPGVSVTPLARSRQLEELSTAWRRFYEGGEGAFQAPGQIVMRGTSRRSGSAQFRVGEGLRIHARGDITVRCWIEDRTTMEGRVSLASGERKELTISCLPAIWPGWELELVDRHGRTPGGPVTAWVNFPIMRELPVSSLGITSVKLPADLRNWHLAFRAPGLGRATLMILRGDLGRTSRVEFDAVEVVLHFVDDRTGDEHYGKDLEARIGASRGRWEQPGGFHFGLIRADAREVEIRLRRGSGQWLRVPLNIAKQAKRSTLVEETIRVTVGGR